MTTPFLTLIRVMIYLWVGIEFANLAYLYWAGYKYNKPTPIIQALQIMLLFLSILFFVLAFLPVLLDLNTSVHKTVVSALPIILLPVGFAVRVFRIESLSKQSMRLPDKKKLKKGK